MSPYLGGEVSYIVERIKEEKEKGRVNNRNDPRIRVRVLFEPASSVV